MAAWEKACTGHARPRLVGRGHRVAQHGQGPQGVQVGIGPFGPVDPVAHELHPAVAVACLVPHLHEQCLGFHLHGQVPDIATGASHMPSCPDQLRQHVVVLYPAGVGGGAGITHQHGPRGQVSQCLPTRLLNADRALHTEPRCGSWASTRPGMTKAFRASVRAPATGHR